MPLSDLATKAAKPRDKPYKLFDEKGLYLLIMPNGSKYWRLKYHFGSKEKVFAVGVYPAISLGQAREQRVTALDQIKQGIDPSQHKKDTKAAHSHTMANTFEAVAREWGGAWFPHGQMEIIISVC